MESARMPSLQPVGNGNNVLRTISPLVVAESAAAQAAPAVVAVATSPRIGPSLGGAAFATPTKPATAVTTSSSERHLSGLKPIVPLRKRGQSFRETKKITTSVDSEGRRRLNQYTFLEELGRGAYGLVLKVESNETKEVFAAKIVDKKALKRVRVGRFGNALQTVKKELSIWKRFTHRHIVVLREVIDTDDSDELYMISELVEGGPVLDGEAHCTPLNAEETKLYFCHLIEGIDFLHENKIVHRDIKPGNLLLKSDGEGGKILKIADFGVSHEMESDDDSLRQTAGTAIFMGALSLRGSEVRAACADTLAHSSGDAHGRELPRQARGHLGVRRHAVHVRVWPPAVRGEDDDGALRSDSGAYSHLLLRNDPIQYLEQVGERVVEKELIDLMQHILEKNPEQRYGTSQIRAHPWAWRDFQTSAMKCVRQQDPRRSSAGLAAVASVGKSLRGIFSRPKVVFPALTTTGSSNSLTSSSPVSINSDIIIAARRQTSK